VPPGILPGVRIESYLSRQGWTAADLAREVRNHLPRGVRTNPATIHRLLRADTRAGPRRALRTASPELALAIERATGGAVRADEVPVSRATRRLLRAFRRPQAAG